MSSEVVENACFSYKFRHIIFPFFAYFALPSFFTLGYPVDCQHVDFFTWSVNEHYIGRFTRQTSLGFTPSLIGSIKKRYRPLLVLVPIESKYSLKSIIILTKILQTIDQNFLFR